MLKVYDVLRRAAREPVHFCFPVSGVMWYRARVTIAVLPAVVMVVLQQAAGVSLLDATAARRYALGLDYCLEARGATRADLALRTDFLEPSPFLLRGVRESIEQPYSLPDVAARAAEQVRAASPPVDLLAWCSAQLNLSTGALALTPSPENPPDRRPQRAVQALRDRLPPLLFQQVVRSLETIERAEQLTQAGLALIPTATRALLVEALPETLLDEQATAPGRDDPGTLEGARRMRALMAAAAQVEQRPFLLAARALLIQAQQWLAAPPLAATFAEGVLLDLEMPAGRVLITGSGRDIVHLDRPTALFLDLGGDDVVIDERGFAPGQVSLHVDLGGHDRLVATGPGAGSSLLGAAIYLDRSGNDTYEGGHFASGVGVLGAGVLWDCAGNDLYTGDCAAQGCGLAGVGLLLDDAGNDRYLAQAGVQGFGAPGGVGLLLDRAGKDVYLAGYHYPDSVVREQPGYITLAQGCGYGYRPFAAGGAGYLIDLAGSDIYRSDYFGQGVGYWLGLGILADLAGDDTYEATRYCQGSGVHLAAGVLLDGAGNDRYTCWGVALGAGHDLAAGVLFDAAGDDRYNAEWLAIGAGNGNGVGLFFDGAGRDRYVWPPARKVSGFGQYFDEREDGSLGIAIDVGGADRYEAEGGDGQWWDTGQWGFAVDQELNGEGSESR